MAELPVIVDDLLSSLKTQPAIFGRDLWPVKRRIVRYASFRFSAESYCRRKNAAVSWPTAFVNIVLSILMSLLICILMSPAASGPSLWSRRVSLLHWFCKARRM